MSCCRAPGCRPGAVRRPGAATSILVYTAPYGLRSRAAGKARTRRPTSYVTINFSVSFKIENLIVRYLCPPIPACGVLTVKPVCGARFAIGSFLVPHAISESERISMLFALPATETTCSSALLFPTRGLGALPGNFLACPRPSCCRCASMASAHAAGSLLGCGVLIMSLNSARLIVSLPSPSATASILATSSSVASGRIARIASRSSA